MRRPRASTGAVVGGLIALAFTALHFVAISDIWFNLMPMVFAGALCGACLVWSYNAAFEAPSVASWFSYLGGYAGLLILLGASSFLVLEPQFTMSELMIADDALQRVLPHGVTLMVVATLVGTVAFWLWYGRRPRAIVPILVTVALLVFLVGHNLAILGIVEMTAGLVTVALEFFGLTLFLAAGVAGGVWLAERIPSGDRLREGADFDPAP